MRTPRSIRIPVSWITKSRRFLICSKSLQTRLFHTAVLKCVLDCVYILQNTSHFSKDTKYILSLATLNKCPPQTTWKCFLQQRKYFTHTVNLNLWGTCWFLFHPKQLRNALYSDSVRAVLQNIWGMNLSSAGTSKISPGAWIEFRKAEQKLICCHTCMPLPLKRSCVLGKQPGLLLTWPFTGKVTRRDGESRRESWDERTLIKHLPSLCFSVMYLLTQMSACSYFQVSVSLQQRCRRIKNCWTSPRCFYTERIQAKLPWTSPL